MLPLMDKPEGEAVEGILHSIAVDYPQVEPLLTALCVCVATRICMTMCGLCCTGNMLPFQDQHQ